MLSIGPRIVLPTFMARRPRIQLPGAVYHVMSRGNRKGPIYEDDADRIRFLAVLKDAAHRYEVRVYAVCLMGNHYHLVFDTPRGNISNAMQFINGVYSQASNRRHHRSGHLFEARYRSLLVQRESYLRRVNRYVVRNPVRAGLTKEAGEWSWSTYRSTAGLESCPSWLHVDWLTYAFRTDDVREAHRKYRDYVNNPLARKARVDLTSLAIGSRAFQQAICDAARERRADRILPVQCRRPARQALATLFAESNGLTGGRMAGVHAAVLQGYHLSEVAIHLGVHRSTVSRLFARAQKG